VQTQFQRRSHIGEAPRRITAAAVNKWGMLVALTFVMGAATHTQAAPEVKRARVAVPVADLRKEPVRAGTDLEHDSLEESQLLYGDPVEVLEEKEGWTRVAALEQLEFTHNNRWEGYPGWVESSQLVPEPGDWKPDLVVTAKLGMVRDKPNLQAPVRAVLSVGTHLMGKVDTQQESWWWRLRLLDGTIGWIPADQTTRMEAIRWMFHRPGIIRERLVQTARLFLNDPYYWGGRSAFNPNALGSAHTAVDCSGLVGLVYQANVLPIPRDAHEQWLQALPIPPERLAPGDVIFLHDAKNPDKVTHVMLYIGENRVIEGPGTGSRVREIDLTERLKEAKGRRISFGTYLP